MLRKHLKGDAMSKGLGRIQRAILELIARNPDGAWQTSEICRHVYGSYFVTKAQRVSVLRALRQMKLPGTWEIWRSSERSGESWLCDPCDDESRFQAARSGYAHEDYLRRLRETVSKEAARARRYRDGSPLERMAMDIEDQQAKAKYYDMIAPLGGDKRKAACGLALEEIAVRVEKMKAELARMNADAT